MAKKIGIVLLLIYGIFLYSNAVFAHIAGKVTDTYHGAKVVEINNDAEKILYSIEITTGLSRGAIIHDVSYVASKINNVQPTIKVGDSITIAEGMRNKQYGFYIIDVNRNPQLGIIFAIFILIAFLLGGKRSIFAIASAMLSGFFIIQYIVPKIASGSDPILLGLIALPPIAIIMTILSHGPHKRIVIATIGTIITLCFSMLLAWITILFSNSFGNGIEGVYELSQITNIQPFNLRGLLLVGILLSVIGLLDDVTTTLVTAIEQVHIHNPALGWKELFNTGFKIGQEHILSLINTLFLVYAGASLPLFMFFYIQGLPVWIVISSPIISEEIIRTLVGSLALFTSIPITSFLAAYIYSYKKSS